MWQLILVIMTGYDTYTAENIRRVKEWKIHHMDVAPFHKVCYDSSINTRNINNFLNEYGNNSVLAIDPYHDMTPLHMLTMTPHAPAETIGALLDVDIEVDFCLDGRRKMSLDYCRDYNVGGLVAMINGLCDYRRTV